MNKRKEEGQGLVEYALILVLVAIVVIAILTILGPTVAGVYARVGAGLNGQSLTGNGAEAAVMGPVEKSGSGFCTFTVAAGTKVVPLQDGRPVPNATVTVQMMLGTQLIGSQPVTTNGNGVGELSSPLNGSGLCNRELSFSFS